MSYVLVTNYHSMKWVLGNDGLFHKPGSAETRIFETEQSAFDERRKAGRVDTGLYVMALADVLGCKVKS